MSRKQENQDIESLRVKEALVEALITQPDAEVLDDAAVDGLRPEEAQRRVLGAFYGARQSIAARSGNNAPQEKSERVPARTRALSIDAARARAILKRVAAAASIEGVVPLPHAARIDQVKGDAEALEMVATLKNLGVISDEDLK